MNILGISFLEDASACVLKDGRLIAALAQERLNRKKLWFGVPHEAIREVLKLTNTHIDEIDFIATHGKCTRPDRVPFDQKIELIIQSQLDERGKQEQIEAVEKRYQHEVQVCTERTPTYLSELDRYNKPIVTYGHHEAHAASAIYGWGEKNCYLLTADGWGEDGSSTLWKVENGLMKKLSFSHPFDSLGYFYGSVTKSLGFIPHRHEGKVLGLAAFCRNPKSYDGIRAMIDFDRENMRFLGKMENGLYRPHFDNPRLDQFVKSYSREDVASAAQISLEEVVCARQVFRANNLSDHLKRLF